jgi:hypothetical protein
MNAEIFPAACGGVSKGKLGRCPASPAPVEPGKLRGGFPASSDGGRAAFKCRLFFCVAALPLAGCVDVKPIEVKPIHVTVDVNVNVKVDKSLDNYFDDIDEKSTTVVPAAKPAAQPASAPAPAPAPAAP